MDNKLWNILTNDLKLTELNLKQLEEEYLNDNKNSELLSLLCEAIPKIGNKWYPLYKITVIMKYLCIQNPKQFSSLLLQKMNILKSLKNYAHKDNYGVDQGANIRINVEQLLNFAKEENKVEDKQNTRSIRWNQRLDLAADQLLQTLDSLSVINSETILQKLKSDVSLLNKNLPGPLTFEKYTGLDESPQIDGYLYGKLVERIVRTFDDNWPSIDDKIDPAIERFIIVDGSTFLMFHETLIVLTDALKKSPNEKVTKSIVQILENLMKSDSLLSALTEICKDKEETAIEREDIESKWKSLLQIIVSLPNRIANKLDGKIRNSFLPDNYVKIITYHTMRAMIFLNESRKIVNAEPNVKMISMLISKAMITLGAGKLESMIDIMSVWYLEYPQDTRDFMMKILSHIDRRAMEPIAVLFLKRNETILDIAFADLLNDSHWRHVFTTKIPLMSYYKDDNVARNLIAFLSKSSVEKRILPDLLTRLLDIWGDKSALNHTSLDQQEYITKLILMSVRRVKKILTEDEKSNVTRLLFSGISAHLESTQSEMRGIGMITGEMMIEILSDSKDEPKLKYDYEGMPERTRSMVEKLRLLAEIEKLENLHIDKNLSVGKIAFDNMRDRRIYELAMECEIVATLQKNCDITKIAKRRRSETNITDSSEVISQASSQMDDENLDSDDDLTPYDMSNDKAISEKLRPTYLRDLKENLLNSHSNNDPNIFSESMLVAEDLIMSQLPNDDSTFAVELLTIFVTLKENSYTENFELLKYNACIAIVIVYPKECAKYLCNEFHAKIGEYSINDRVFILDVLGEAARRLSKIPIEQKIEDKMILKNRGKKFSGKRVTLAVDTNFGKKHETLYDDDFEVSPNNEVKKIDWEDIIDKRIESKTRRFAHATKYSPTTINRFNDVASAFFYPLLYGFRREGTCMYKTPKSFEDQENILLVSYLKALSTIMLAAENCVIVPKMAKEMMDLAWTLRYHNQANVRLRVIQIVASTVITLPKEGLSLELMELIFEFRGWLLDVSDDGVRGDPDSNCRNLGKNVVALINSIFKSTLNEY